MYSYPSVTLLSIEHEYTVPSGQTVHFGPGQEMVVYRSSGLVRPRSVTVIQGVTGHDRKLGVNGRGVETLATAIAGRVMTYASNGVVLEPLPCSGRPHITLASIKTRILGSFGPKPTPMTREEFVECYNGRRRTIYQNAWESLMDKPVQRSDSYIKAFVKCEKVDCSKTPRVIQPRHPRYNVELGCYIKHIEHRLYRAIARVAGQRVVVAKGLNVLQLGNSVAELWHSVEDCVFVGFDASRFDMHVTVDMLRWEHSVYLSLYNQDPVLGRLLSWQLSTKGFGYCSDGRLKYRTVGHRASGDMNTGLGNCLIMCALILRLRAVLGIKFKFINNGDDCGAFIERRHLKTVMEAVPGFFQDYGFRIVCEEPVDVLEKVSFCGMRPLHCNDGVRMVREFRTAIEKDTLSVTHLPDELSVRKWIYSVGECGLALCSGVPVLQALYQAYVNQGIRSNMKNAVYMESGAMRLAHGLHPKVSPVSSDARVSFWLAFGVTPEEQEHIEDYFSTWSLSGGNEIIELSEISPAGIELLRLI